MVSTDVRIPLQSVMKNITMHVEVTGVRTWKMRMWLALQCFRLGCWIAGMGLKFHGDQASR